MAKEMKSRGFLKENCQNTAFKEQQNDQKIFATLNKNDEINGKVTKNDETTWGVNFLLNSKHSNSTPSLCNFGNTSITSSTNTCIPRSIWSPSIRQSLYENHSTTTPENYLYDNKVFSSTNKYSKNDICVQNSGIKQVESETSLSPLINNVDPKQQSKENIENNANNNLSPFINNKGNSLFDIFNQKPQNNILETNSHQLSQQQQQHQQNQQQKNPKLYKTELCRSWADTGRCNYGERCQYAHGEGEKRPIPRHPKYKTEACQSYHKTGYCPYGPRCHFIHNEEPYVIAGLVAGNNASKGAVMVGGAGSPRNSTPSASSDSLYQGFSRKIGTLRQINSLTTGLGNNSCQEMATSPTTANHNITSPNAQLFGGNNTNGIIVSQHYLKTHSHQHHPLMITQSVGNSMNNSANKMIFSDQQYHQQFRNSRYKDDENNKINNIEFQNIETSFCIGPLQKAPHIRAISARSPLSSTINREDFILLHRHNSQQLSSTAPDLFNKLQTNTQFMFDQNNADYHNDFFGILLPQKLSTAGSNVMMSTKLQRMHASDITGDSSPHGSLADSGTESPELESSSGSGSSAGSGTSIGFSSPGLEAPTSCDNNDKLAQFSLTSFQNHGSIKEISDATALHPSYTILDSNKNEKGRNNASMPNFYKNFKSSIFPLKNFNLDVNDVKFFDTFQNHASIINNENYFTIDNNIQFAHAESDSTMITSPSSAVEFFSRNTPSSTWTNPNIFMKNKNPTSSESELLTKELLDKSSEYSLRRASGSSLGSVGVAHSTDEVNTPISSSSAASVAEEMWNMTTAAVPSLNSLTISSSITTARLPIFEQFSNSPI